MTIDNIFSRFCGSCCRLLLAQDFEAASACTPAGLPIGEPTAANQETQRLRDQLQRLKGELMRTSRAHEEEQARTEADADARVVAAESQLSAERQAAQALKSELRRAQTEAAERAEAATAAQAQVALLRMQLDNASETANGDITGHGRAEEPVHPKRAYEALAADAEQLRRELDTLRTEHAAVIAGSGTAERSSRENQQALEARLRDSEAQCAEFQMALVKSQQSHSAHLAELRQEASALAQQVQQAEASAREARVQLEAERAPHGTAAEEVARLRQAPAQQDEAQRLQVELNRALADVEGFEELHDATVAELADLRSQLKAQTAEAQSAAREHSEVHRLQVELDRALADLEGFGELHDATVAEVADLRAQLEGRTAEAELTARKVTDLQAAVAHSSGHQTELTDLRALSERQGQAAGAAKKEIRRVQQQLKAAEAALAARDAFWQAEMAAARTAHEQMARELRQRASELEARLAASSQSQTCDVNDVTATHCITHVVG